MHPFSLLIQQFTPDFVNTSYHQTVHELDVHCSLTRLLSVCQPRPDHILENFRWNPLPDITVLGNSLIHSSKSPSSIFNSGNAIALLMETLRNIRK